MRRAMSRRACGAIGVIALCAALNLAMWLAPKRDEPEPAPAPHAEQSEPEAPRPAQQPAVEIPVPQDLPDGTDPQQLVEQVRLCMEDNGIADATKLEIAESGKSEALTAGTPPASWWVYRATRADGSTIDFTAGYSTAAGFYAAMQ